MNKVAELRNKAGLTQMQLAAMVGVTFRWVQKIESGDTNLENITLKKGLALADALGVEVRDLLK